jgi:hypothetical protein
MYRGMIAGSIELETGYAGSQESNFGGLSLIGFLKVMGAERLRAAAWLLCEINLTRIVYMRLPDGCQYYDGMAGPHLKVAFVRITIERRIPTRIIKWFSHIFRPSLFSIAFRSTVAPPSVFTKVYLFQCTSGEFRQ